MHHYYALIEGRNYTIKVDNITKKVGFLATFFFSVESENEVISTLENSLKKRVEDNKVTFINSSSSVKPFITLNILNTVTEKEVQESNVKGFTFYDMTVWDILTSLMYKNLIFPRTKKIELKLIN